MEAEMSFPYRNIVEVDTESNAVILAAEISRDNITWDYVRDFNAKADIAFANKDYRNHSIYASAAHKCATLFRDCGKHIL
jgi:hypothetical protein